MEYIKELHGIGEVSAKKIYAKIKKFGINAKSTRSRVRTVLRKIADELPVSAQADLRYNPDGEIPRQIIEILDSSLRANLKGIKFEIAGSYKREKPISHDIDIVISRGTRDLSTIWDKIRNIDGTIKFEEPYARGESKIATFVNIVGEWVAKVDIFITQPADYVFMLLYATGSGSFNIRMRALAKRKGYLLNQKGLYDKKTGKKMPLKNEKEIFKFLGMKFKKPKDRVF
jgi:DNA polymerase/3'-5' exonuclease PolX